MPLAETLASRWDHIQGFLFPLLEQELGPLSPKLEELIVVLDLAGIEGHLRSWPNLPGRPQADRHAIARAFVAKSVLGLPTTRALIERLAADRSLRRLCGWDGRGQLPSQATFSRAFEEFAASSLPARLHATLIEKTHKDRLVGHISRDSTAIEARERPVKQVKPAAQPKRKRGRPRKGFESGIAKPARRLAKQPGMSLAAMLAELPTACTVSAKLNAKGFMTNWTGYKLHLDVADGDIPVAALLTSASLHDSQAALPLATITAARVRNLYDLMDSAYDAPEIWAHSRALGHVPIIAKHPRCSAGKAALKAESGAQRRAGYRLAEDVRKSERSAAERVNSALKDRFGARWVQVRGHAKVFCHLMFGVLSLTAGQLMRLVQ